MSRPPRAKAAPVRAALLAVLRFYQRAISPAFPPRCRFYPTCSTYAVEAIERHGAARGTWLALRRLVKCAPWHPGGVDLVPGGPDRASPAPPAPPADPAVPDPTDPASVDRATPPAPRATQEESTVVT